MGQKDHKTSLGALKREELTELEKLLQDGGRGFHLQDGDATVTQRAIPVTPLMRTALRDP
jgi:hypothetical protein